MFDVTKDTSNKDLKVADRQGFLDMFGSFNSRMPNPKDLIQPFEDKFVFRADLAPAGLKAFGAEKVISETKEDILVYCAPRVGHAPDAIATLAKMYGKKCVFFCPASKQASRHQAVLKAHGADLRFIKIAAMPTLNIYAKRWAEKHGAKFLPFGLSGVPDVTAGLVNMASKMPEPTEAWMAVSTGTMIRALQIAWPNTVCKGVAVARNMHNGEIGNAIVRSATMPFLRGIKEQDLPPFPTTATYDAKAWTDFVKLGKPGSMFINVGSDESIERLLTPGLIESINSNRKWHDMTDLNRGPN